MLLLLSKRCLFHYSDVFLLFAEICLQTFNFLVAGVTFLDCFVFFALEHFGQNSIGFHQLKLILLLLVNLLVQVNSLSYGDRPFIVDVSELFLELGISGNYCIMVKVILHFHFVFFLWLFQRLVLFAYPAGALHWRAAAWAQNTAGSENVSSWSI